MNLLLLLFALLCLGAVGHILGIGLKPFLKKREDPFAPKRHLPPEEDPDIQTNMHGPE